MSKFTSREFTNYMNSKGYINNPMEYLPRLTEWINAKIVFWRTDLESNVLALNTPRGGNKRCFAVSTTEAGSNGTNYNRRNFEKKTKL